MKNLVPEFNFCVVDLETTGLKAQESEIIEVGAIELSDGRIGETFHEMVNPGQPIPEKITEITGIEDDDVNNADPVEPVLERFFNFAEDSILVAHNASFDLSFLRYHHPQKISHDFIDTLLLARNLLDLESNSLDELTNHFNIPLESAHRALNDSLATAELFLELTELFEEEMDYYRCKIPESILTSSNLETDSIKPETPNAENRIGSDDTVFYRWIFYALYEMDSSVGINKLTKILTGSRDKTVQKYRYLTSYGMLSHLTQATVEEEIKNLVRKGTLKRNDRDTFPVLSLTDEARSILTQSSQLTTS